MAIEPFIRAELEVLSTLKDGWLEGGGVAPSAESLEWLTGEVVATFPDELEYPTVVPTEDGNVAFEWIRPKSRIELEINFADDQLELYATDVESGDFVEQQFGKRNWEEAFGRVSQLLS